MESQSISDGDGDGPVGPDEAQDALLVVERMRRTALRRSLPPRWLGGLLSILIGVMCGAHAAASPAVTAVALLAMTLVLGLKRRTVLALARRSSYGLSLQMIAVQVGGVLLIIAGTLGGEVWFVKYGVAWAPIAAGAVCGATIYILFLFKLSAFRASIESEQSG